MCRKFDLVFTTLLTAAADAYDILVVNFHFDLVTRHKCKAVKRPQKQ